MSRDNTKKNKKSGRAANTVILIIAIVVMAFALYKLIPILIDYKQADDNYAELVQDYVDTGDITGDVEEGYDWAGVQIDFDSLKAINPDVVGWIRFDDTDAVNVDYPILHADDNDTYLHKDLLGEEHSAGSIFLEAANSPDFSDYYNIIYGHNMKNGSMFGTLKKYNRDENFYDANQYFTIYTEQGAYRYQIFSYENVADDSEIYTVGYAPDEQYQALIDTMVSGSMKDTGITPTNENRIVTLSTCSSSDTIRFVVHGVCIDQKLYE